MLTILATAVGAFTMMAFASANETNSTDTTTDTTQTTQTTDHFRGDDNMMMEAQCFGGFTGRRGGHGGMGGYSTIEVSSEYTDNINAILNSDSDVQNLISQGYNVTSIKPIIKNVIEGDGTLTTKATTATVIMKNGESGYATISVDVANEKVTQIVTITRTVIDKTSS
ncbi:MAG: hypothetical protein NWE95_13030 [Candidatus Bathyarchaeota archaeon]|nr:hypothetical protein [Candidatus Bathyarchaeota archaeon]